MAPKKGSKNKARDERWDRLVADMSALMNERENPIATLSEKSSNCTGQALLCKRQKEFWNSGRTGWSSGATTKRLSTWLVVGVTPTAQVLFVNAK
jgi:hypothetical protein